MVGWLVLGVVLRLVGELAAQVLVEGVGELVIWAVLRLPGELRTATIRRRKRIERRRSIPMSDVTWLVYLHHPVGLPRLAGLSPGAWPAWARHGTRWPGLLADQVRAHGWGWS